MVLFKHEQNIICRQTQLDEFAHEQTIICRQLFAGHVLGSQPMKRKKYNTRYIPLNMQRVSSFLIGCILYDMG